MDGARSAKAQLVRSSVYPLSRPVPPARLAIMHQIDTLHLEHLFARGRMLRDLRRPEGITIGGLAVATLMRQMAKSELQDVPAFIRSSGPVHIPPSPGI